METEEMLNILASIVVLSFIFGFNGFGNLDLHAFMRSAAIVSASFIAHELAHRQVARKLGFYARYEIWGFGVLISLLLLLVSNGSIKFASLGAVAVYPISDLWGFGKALTRRDMMLISLAGPLSNILLAALGIALLGFSPGFWTEWIGINIWLAFFNLLPAPPLDGFKVFSYDWRIWLIVFIPVAVAVMLL